MHTFANLRVVHLSLKDWMEKPGCCGDDSAHGQLVFPRESYEYYRGLETPYRWRMVHPTTLRTIVGFGPEKTAQSGTSPETVTTLREAGDSKRGSIECVKHPVRLGLHLRPGLPDTFHFFLQRRQVFRPVWIRAKVVGETLQKLASCRSGDPHTIER